MKAIKKEKLLKTKAIVGRKFGGGSAANDCCEDTIGGGPPDLKNKLNVGQRIRNKRIRNVKAKK